MSLSPALLWFEEEHARVAREAHARMIKSSATTGIIPSLYLYSRPGLLGGGLAFAEDKPGPEWELVWQERLPSNLEAYQCVKWTRDKSTRVDCIPSHLA